MAYQHTTDYDLITPIEAVGKIPAVRSIGIADIEDSLAKGLDDFRAMPTHALFLAIIYPIAGLIVAHAVFNEQMWSLLYPLAAGFALIGPFAAIGLYELSRRREEGRDTHWLHVFDVRHSPSFKSILGLGLLLMLLFVVWIAVAQGMYYASFGKAGHASLSSLVKDVFSTPQGHTLLLVGNLVGLAFAVAVLAVSVISFPLMLDRHVGIAAAVTTSLKAVIQNPVPMLLWGLIVALILAVASIPALFGLAIALPVLGHATWHLYRKVVPSDGRPRPRFEPKPRRPHYAAEFPASLFVGSSVDEDK